MEAKHNNLHIVSHPLIKDKLASIRDKKTPSPKFTALVNEVAMLMAYEITKDIPLAPIEVETPVGMAKCEIYNHQMLLVPILRAGIGMVNGILNLVPSAKVGHIGIYRDEETLLPNTYYFKIPKGAQDMDVILIDPMLATGGSISAALDRLKAAGCSNIKLLCLVAAPEGVNYLYERHPEIPIYTAVVDEKLNEKGYIIPGLGDAGDRLFGTI
ncbi:MAG: uracil phosphoribosyltransferase [Elusimicrobiota bacterium]|jgi:uracil phosphoribosyltransferase|nr:uracil phosphoribosyltransferase [Elusimicrobiota bacterium]